MVITQNDGLKRTRAPGAPMGSSRLPDHAAQWIAELLGWNWKPDHGMLAA